MLNRIEDVANRKNCCLEKKKFVPVSKFRENFIFSNLKKNKIFYYSYLLLLLLL